jgi:hypothetical protein
MSTYLYISNWLELFFKNLPIIIISLSGGIWALILFINSNKIKAANILTRIEKRFKKHINILLQIESSNEYQNKVEKVIKNALNKKYEKDDKKILKKLDSLFRHFHMCYHVKKLKADNGSLDEAYKYYLLLMIDKEHQY